MAGRPFVPVAPTAIDWWIASGSGQGGAVTTFELPDESVSVAVVALGEADLSGMTISGSYDVRGGFGIGLGIAVAGLGVVLFGWVTFRGTAYAAWDGEEWDEDDQEEWDEDYWEDKERQETTPVRGGAP